MLIRELLISKSDPVGSAIPGADRQSEGARDIAEQHQLERLARCCASFFRQFDREKRKGRHASAANSGTKTMGRVKEEGPPKNAKPPAVPKPRKLKGPNVIKPKVSIKPPKPLKPVGK